MDLDRMGSPRERVCKAPTSRAHVFAWGTPRSARFALNAQGDVMAARVVGIRQEGIKSLLDGAVQEERGARSADNRHDVTGKRARVVNCRQGARVVNFRKGAWL